MGQATGRVTVKIDGKPLRSKPGASFQPGGVNRAGDMTDQNEYYYSEKNTPAEIKCTMPHMADTDVIALRRFKNGTVTWSDDIGTTHTITKAVTAEVGPIQNGEVEVTFQGQPVE